MEGDTSIEAVFLGIEPISPLVHGKREGTAPMRVKPTEIQ